MKIKRWKMIESRRGGLDMVLKSSVQKGEINKRKGKETKGWERIQKGRKGMGSSILAVAEENNKRN